MKVHFHEKPWRFHCVLLFVGACATVAGPATRAALFTVSGENAEGVVARVEWRRVTHRRSAPFHHFKYTSADGTPRAGRTRYPSLFISAGEGERVPVRYRSGDAEITSLNHLWGAPGIGFVVIVILLRLIIGWCRENVSVAYRT